MYPLVDLELTIGQIASNASAFPVQTDVAARRRFLLRAMLDEKFDFAFPVGNPLSVRAVQLIAGTNLHPLLAFRDPQSRKRHREIIEASGDPYLRHSLMPNRDIGHPAFEDNAWDFHFPYDQKKQSPQSLENLRQELLERLPPLEAFDEHCLNMLFDARLSKAAYLSFCLRNNYQDYQFWHHGPIAVRDTSQWLEADAVMQELARGPRITKPEAIEAMKRVAPNLSARELNQIWSLRAPPPWRKSGRRRKAHQ